ncbi:LysR family transcriptional regulator [Romboutsia sedimentorum]|uniref:LysR family transcriptional regulator n=1 Tax=Romboutsia sedimentorum TaxID=1368474 RepID=A0ABT7E9V9_9FIRM|nr:LysR family transcriptional regulator [Romboutsia sedimentorum]MDK2563715.1 LysR family transcriptional regulator [Romboutsia sedimentorum]
MDIKTLKYFLQICKDGSFSKAAKNLYISQQGLSKAIGNLEKEINVDLFYRHANGNELTKYGEYLKSKAISIVYQFDILTEGIKEMVDEDKGYLRVGVSYGVINALSIDIIKEFNNLYPDIILTIKEYTDFNCEEAVLNGEVDLGFAIHHFDSDKFNSQLVKSKKLYALINKNHNLCDIGKIEFKDLKNEKIIINSNHSKLRHNFLIKCLENEFDPNIAIETDEIVLIHDLSKRNEGIGISINFAHTPNCKINYVPFKDETFVWDIYMITKKDIYDNKYITLFKNFILSRV